MDPQTPSYNPLKPYTPQYSVADLQKISPQIPWSLPQFISYSYHTISNLKQSQYKKLDLNSINILTSKNVISQSLPCLIYQHICQTFCSLIQAKQDGDDWLVQKQCEEIIESINSFCKEKQYRNYQCFNQLEIDQNISDTILKWDLVQKINGILQEISVLDRSTVIGGTISKKQITGNTMTGISTMISGTKISEVKAVCKQIQAKHVKRVKPLLSKLISKINNSHMLQSHQSTKSNGHHHHHHHDGNKHEKQQDQKQFVVLTAIKRALAVNANA